MVGEQAALDLVWAFRGVMLYVPKHPATKPQIAAAIGDEAAARLCEVFWGTEIYMPYTLALAHRVHEMAEKGHTRQAIALALGVRERRVYRILERGVSDSSLRSQRADSAQGSLFPDD